MEQVTPVTLPQVRSADRLDQSTIDTIIAEIARRFQPDQIILFGSWATGATHTWSDLDLLVIMDTSVSESRQALDIAQVLQLRFGLDIIVRTPSHLAERLALGDWFLRDIVSHGKVVYERIDRGVDRQS